MPNPIVGHEQSGDPGPGSIHAATVLEVSPELLPPSSSLGSRVTRGTALPAHICLLPSPSSPHLGNLQPGEGGGTRWWLSPGHFGGVEGQVGG